MHYSGEFVEQLPPELRPSGPNEWHQHSPECPTLLDAVDHALKVIDAARARCARLHERDGDGNPGFEALCRAIRAQGPDAGGVGASAHEARLGSLSSFHASAGPPVLQIDIGAVSEYMRATERMSGGGKAIAFPGGRGLVWSAVEGSDDGSVEIGVNADRTVVVLATVCADDDAGLEAAREHARGAADGEALGALDVADGALVVATALLRVDDVAELGSRPLEGLLALVASEPEASLEGVMGDDGVVLRVASGRYEAWCATHEADDWSVNWCRLERRGSRGGGR